MGSEHHINRIGDQCDRFVVPGGWIYRTWMLAPHSNPAVNATVRVQMQAVFVPDPEKGPAAAHMVHEISSAATECVPTTSSAQPLVAGLFSGSVLSVRPEVWPKDYTKVACDIWIARWGNGSAPGDVIGMNLRQLKKGEAPWDAVIRSFRRYVETVEDQFASPAAWRKRWRSYDPDEPEHDHEAAKIADSYDRTLRRQGRSTGGFRPAAETLRRLPEGEK